MNIFIYILPLAVALMLKGCSEESVGAGKGRILKFLTDGNKDSEIDLQIYGGEIPVNLKDENQVTPLIYASRSGNVDLVKYLIRSGAEINYESDSSGSPLYGALFKKNYDVAAILIDNGADPDFPPYLPPIFIAIRKGDIEQVYFLVENGSDVNQVHQDGKHPLSFACMHAMFWSTSEYADRNHKLFVYKHIIEYLMSKTSEEAKSRVDDDGNTYVHYLQKVDTM